MMTILWIILAIIALEIAVCTVIKIKYDEDIQADEVHSLRMKDGWRIKLYRRVNKGNPGEPVLLCHGVMGNPTNFQYPKGNAMVDTLVEHGYDCWLIDLRGNRHCAPPLGTSRYTATYDQYLSDFPEVIHYIREHCNQQKIHWVGHSMGGMLLYSYATAYGSEALASGTVLGTPPGFVDLHLKPMKTLVKLVTLIPFLADPIMRTLAHLGPVFKISTSFAPINWENISPDVNFYTTIEYAPPAVARQMEDWASSGTWTLKEADINMMDALPKMDFPLYLMAGSLDPLAPVASVQKLHDSLSLNDTRLTILGKEHGCQYDYNHVDLVFSKNGRDEVYLPICDWLKIHSTSASPKKRSVKKKTAVKKKTPSKKKAAAKKKTAAKKKVTSKKKASSKPKTKAKAKRKPSA